MGNRLLHPLKDANLVEIIRGAVLWLLWLDRNRIVKDGRIHDIKTLGSKIISTAYFWASQQKSDLTAQLNLILLCDVKVLIGTTTVVFMEDIQDTTHMLGTEMALDGEVVTQSPRMRFTELS